MFRKYAIAAASAMFRSNHPSNTVAEEEAHFGRLRGLPRRSYPRYSKYKPHIEAKQIEKARKRAAKIAAKQAGNP